MIRFSPRSSVAPRPSALGIGPAGLTAALLVLTACGGDGGGTGPDNSGCQAASVNLDPGSAQIFVGNTQPFSATVLNSSGGVVSCRLTWVSAAPAVASVNDNGLVTAEGGGQAQITARTERGVNGIVSGSAQVTVPQPDGTAQPGGTVIQDGQARVSVDVPAGGVSAATPITIIPAVGANLPGDPTAGTVVPNSAFEFGPTGLSFGTAATLSIGYNRSALPAGTAENGMEIYRVQGNNWVRVNGSEVDTGSEEVRAPISGFSVYAIVAPSNEAPEVTISQPQDGATFSLGESVTFEGSATDPEDGALTGSSLAWTSSIDGAIGTGTSFTTSVLSEGVHTITLTATDSEGAEGSASRTITLEAVPQTPPAFAYAYARQPETSAYTPDPADYENFSGGSIQIERTATGRYVVTFNGIGLGLLGEAFTVLVNAVAAFPNDQLEQGGAACRLSNLDASAPARAYVECEDPSTGAAIDARYRILLVGNDVLAGTGAPGEQAAFSLHNDLQATTTYTPHPRFSWNSEGGAQTVTPQGEGLFRHITGLDISAPFTLGISTQDGAAGTGGDICALQNGADTFIDVLCLGRQGGTVNKAHFALQFSGGRPGTQWAYAFVLGGEGVNSTFSTSTGGSISAIQQGPGKWRLVFSGIELTATPAIMVTPVVSIGSAWVHCSHHRAANAPLTVDVACYDTTLGFVETSFTVAVLR